MKSAFFIGGEKMKIFGKHGEQQPVISKSDFTGGLNTASQIDDIAENQLADVLNMEIDIATGKLQYFDGTKLKTLDSSPFVIYDGKNNQVTMENPIAENVFVRQGRVCFTSGSKIYYSAIGDENFYFDDTNRKDTAKWIEVGYKDGAKIKAVVSLSNDVLIIKDNKKVYRLAGENPQWQLAEVASEVNCSGRLSVCKVGDVRMSTMRKVFLTWSNGALQCDLFKAIYCNINPQYVGNTSCACSRIQLGVTGTYCQSLVATLYWDCNESPQNFDLVSADYNNHKTVYQNCTCTICSGQLEIYGHSR